MGFKKDRYSKLTEQFRLVVLGIDGMDYDYVSEHLSELPTINRLSKIGTVKRFRSVFPPDSIPSWITCYTGKDPSEHGVLESVNYLDSGNDRLKVDTSAFKGKTFWDYISRAGFKVCVINPFMAYPVWPVNGVMVNGPVFINGNIQVSNKSWTSGIKIPSSLGGIVDFPTKKNLDLFIKKTFADTSEQADFGCQIWKSNNPDFYFQTFLTMDRIQHFLWRYCDPNDPTYPGATRYKSTIKQFYQFIDQIIARFWNGLSPGDHLIVLSDHGHGMRCTHCFNINEFLRKHGFVRSVAEGKLFNIQLLIEKSKNGILNFMYDHDLEDHISKLAKLLPNAKKIKKGHHITKESENIAFASDFTGTNPFGGICINKNMVTDYNETRNKLLLLLSSIKIDGANLFKWITEREKLFGGKYLNRLPDILFCLNSQYGVSWNLHTKEITINPTHKKISGGHKEFGVLFSTITKDKFIDDQHINMYNFFSTLLSLFGLENQAHPQRESFITAP